MEVLQSDVADIEQELPPVDEWAIDRLRVLSPRLEEPFESIGSPRPRNDAVSDLEMLTPPGMYADGVATVSEGLGVFRAVPHLSTLDKLPGGEGLSGSLFPNR
jgi:hypothetical protein